VKKLLDYGDQGAGTRVFADIVKQANYAIEQKKLIEELTVMNCDLISIIREFENCKAKSSHGGRIVNASKFYKAMNKAKELINDE
jgi:hypothetical protein